MICRKDGPDLELLAYAIAIPVLALIIDLILGEPPNRFHPVVWIGRTIGYLDDHVGRGSPRREKLLGVFVDLIPILLFVFLFTLLLALLRDLLGAVVWAIAAAILFKTMFAVRSLETHTAPMIADLQRGDLDAARRKASMVVSRDVNALDQPHVISCAAETISENLVDSVLSPMFYFGLAGIPGATFLRVANTADGMVGYLSERHRNVGWFSARLDDCAHYLVARLSVPFILLSLALLGKDWRKGWTAGRRDHGQTSSPNKGWPMATVAGGLGVRFEKMGHYSMGEGSVPQDPLIIRDTINVMKLTAVLFFALVLLPLFTLMGIHVQLYLENWLLGLIG
jgi:adenosylcobinamide-phosphate synthase